MSAAAPKREGERQWPARVAFLATAKLSYVRKGARMKVEVAPDIFEDRFRMTGYEGRISFTLRAANLLRDVKSVTVRVGVRMRAPVSEVSEAVRTIDVTWTADKAIGNDSLNSWVNYDSFAYAVTPRWYDGRLDGVVPLTADAYVTSVTLLDGTQLQFDVPDFSDQQKK